MFSGLESPLHLLLLLVLLLVLFGPKRLPEIGRSLGTTIGEFRESMTFKATAAGDAQAQTRAELPTATEAAADPSVLSAAESTEHRTAASRPA